MELTALSLTEVLTVLGGFAAAVTVLYLLKLRRREVEVPFVLLWHQVLDDTRTTRLWSTLKRLLSLLIALAIVAALAFAMGDPRYAGAQGDGRTTVVLLDASASMQATDVLPSRFEVARTTIGELVDEMRGEDRMLIAQMDRTTVPLTPLSSEPHALHAGLEDGATTDVAADLSRGLRFALDVLRDQPRPRVLIVSDGRISDDADIAARLREAGVELEWQKVGEGGDNVAITAFSVRRYPLDKSRSEALIELFNPSEHDASVELTLLGDGETIEVQRLRVAAGERLRRFFANVSGADRTLEARIRTLGEPVDEQPADDRAYARLPERRRARVMAVTEGNLYLSAALLLDEYLEVVEVTPADYPAPGDFDVILFDAWVPDAAPDRPALYLNPTPRDGAEGPFEVRGEIARPYFDRVDRDHPIVRFTALRDVNIATSLDVVLQDGDEVVAGDTNAPLIVTGSRAGHPFVAFTFDVRRSDLVLRVAWPLLLLNSIDHFVDEDARFFSSYETGETWRVTVPEGTEQATLRTPEGTERPVPVIEGRAVMSGLRAGFYTLEANGAEEILAANLGPRDEATLDPPETLELAGAELGPPERRARSVRTEIWTWLVLAALAVILIEWFTYHRRLTV
ncbi:MAG: VWA domain-containing protein [Sandaracinaceae bacterium]